MYVCICNGLRDKQVKQAINSGADTVGRIFKAHGCKPECAQCVCSMRDMIEESVLPSTTLLAAE